MTWGDWGAYLFVGLLVVFAMWVVYTMTRDPSRNMRPPPKSAPTKPSREVENEFGLFTYDPRFENWTVGVDHPFRTDDVVEVTLEDVNGNPDPAIVPYIPRITANLPDYVKQAIKLAKGNEFVSGEFLQSVAMSGDPETMTLAFYDSDSDDETMIHIEIEKGKAADMTVMH
ncbi:hypothetical protein [Fimbriimonas ginsengisoli]|uniref:Uncharacterized protein n=1 Tax=Fimbriimonas ginsengisoli Gsoil 348 TaxID=661478 RepID=A0A068NJ76_FIMGI|nr:hypothetical protein [Fimbriimonas ginsengisoli]AIE83653.1 hypothetical protein OP10G_0285 [Fimbriimonas ginsengisoli Gsoil 348]